MTVLAWHQIAEDDRPTAVTPRRFARQIDLLLRLRRPVVGLEAAWQDRSSGVALTFDDGHLDTYTQAFPILRARGLTATVYLATAYVSAPGWFETGSRGMTWEMVRELAAAGWTIGSHAVTHRRLTGLDAAGLGQEMRDSRAVIEAALGRPCAHFCAPHGEMDRRVLDAARAAGYRTAAVSLALRHSLPPDPMLIRRSGIYRGNGTWTFLFKAMGADERLRGGSPRRAAGSAPPI